jgi:AGCS family alanine or glycine:cation symporter
MSALYIIGALVVLFTHFEAIPGAFGLIIREAFRFRAVGGGILGYGISAAIGKGVSRGVFSNEAGLGSTVMVYSASEEQDPVKQGMWGIFEVFTDTMVVCTITALTILCSGAYNQTTYLQAMHYDKLIGGTQFFDALPNGVTLTAQAFATTFGQWGHYFVTFSIVLFAMATLMGWSYFGEQGFEYLFGKRYISVYKIIYAAFIIVGAVMKLGFVWDISDTFNGLMAIPNLIAITLLSGEVIAISKRKKRGGRMRSD